MEWFSTLVKNILKSTGASTHPCLTPLEILKGSDASPSKSTCPGLELANQVHELGQAPQNGQNYPKGLSVNRVEGFQQVYEEGNEVHILFDTLLLHLAYREDHVGGAAIWTESTLGYAQLFLRNAGDEAVEDDPSQDLSSDGQDRDAPVVAAVSLSGPILEQGDDCGIPEFFGHVLFFPDAGEE